MHIRHLFSFKLRLSVSWSWVPTPTTFTGPYFIDRAPNHKSDFQFLVSMVTILRIICRPLLGYTLVCLAKVDEGYYWERTYNYFVFVCNPAIVDNDRAYNLLRCLDSGLRLWCKLSSDGYDSSILISVSIDWVAHFVFLFIAPFRIHGSAPNLVQASFGRVRISGYISTSPCSEV